MAEVFKPCPGPQEEFFKSVEDRLPGRPVFSGMSGSGAKVSLLSTTRRPVADTAWGAHLARQASQKADETLFGGPAGGSMAETSNEVGTTLTAEDLLRAKQMLMDNRSQAQATEWASPDTHRLMKLIDSQVSLKPMSEEDLKKSLMDQFYGLPIVLDKTMSPDILVEMRDQRGNSLGRVMA